ncbi:MAG: SET domain-containing protein [Alphaproteobacteria bacterium]|nr:SET domain-containing protein [Alphaproteobacteria bacterium]
MGIPAASRRRPSEGAGVVPKVRVVLRLGELGLVATEAVDAGQAILLLDGVLSPTPTRESVQIGPALHVGIPPELPAADRQRRYLWRFLNHSCQPSARVVGDLVVAIDRVEAGGDVTFDYQTTEIELSNPFQCQCGHCGGAWIRGFRHLSAEEQLRRAPWLADHLRRAMPVGEG